MQRAQAIVRPLASSVATVAVLAGLAGGASAAPQEKGGTVPKGAAAGTANAGAVRQKTDKPADAPKDAAGDGEEAAAKARDGAYKARSEFQRACLDAYLSSSAGAAAVAATSRAAKLRTAEELRMAAEKTRREATPSLPELQACDMAAVKGICASATRREVDVPKWDDEDVRACMRINSGITSGAAGVAADIVQSIAQVVVTKAQAAAWGLLLDKVKEIAHCGEAQTKFSKSCDVLKSLNIRDLVSSPGVLLDAVVADLMLQFGNQTDPRTKDVLTAGGGILGLALLDASSRWSQAGAPGIVRSMRSTVVTTIVAKATAACAPTPSAVDKYKYVFGMCLAQGRIDALSQCTAGEFIKDCGGDADANKEVTRLWDLTTTAFDAKAKPADILNLAFAIGADEIAALPDPVARKNAQDYFSGTKDLVTGLVVDKDWVEATSGGVRIVSKLQASLGPDPDKCKEDDSDPTAAAECKKVKSIDPKTCDPKTADCQTAQTRVALKDEVALLGILAPLGNYALTFDKGSNGDPAAAATAREKIIEELVNRMVNRTDRQSGAVLSLGGSLGAIAGSRFASTDKLHADVAFPLQLELGVGLQTYYAKTGGLHLMASVLDLGQYVNMNATGELKVANPDLSSAVGFGLTAGGWGALRETPIYVGLHASVAPFNQADGKPTFQAGVVSGVYVPLLDFD
jgi:hypothetical protein